MRDITRGGTLARRRVLLAGAAAAPLVLAGCATRRVAVPAPTAEEWHGRLGLTVDDDPPQAFHASFVLRGGPEQGELQLDSPFGTRLATVRWHPGGAELRQGREHSRHASVEALTERISGTALPLAALFDWLQGRPAQVEGWQADLSRHAQGRLTARRIAPSPTATLRIVLDP